MRAYYARMRPKLAPTAATQHLHHLLNAANTLAPPGWFFWPARKAGELLFRKAAIASLPR